MFFTHTVGSNYWRTSKPKTVISEKELMVRYKGVREKGAVDFVECWRSLERTRQKAPRGETSRQEIGTTRCGESSRGDMQR